MMPMLRTGWRTLPFSLLQEFDQEVDRLFDGFDRPRLRYHVGDETSGPGMWIPPMDVVETADAFVCALEVPGLSLDELEITVTDNVVRIQGEKQAQRLTGEERAEYRVFERRYGRFERSFTLPRHVDADNVRARYENGVLRITLPKTDAARTRQIPIDAGPRHREIEAGSPS